MGIPHYSLPLVLWLLPPRPPPPRPAVDVVIIAAILLLRHRALAIPREQLHARGYSGAMFRLGGLVQNMPEASVRGFNA